MRFFLEGWKRLAFGSPERGRNRDSLDGPQRTTLSDASLHGLVALRHLGDQIVNDTGFANASQFVFETTVEVREFLVVQSHQM